MKTQIKRFSKSTLAVVLTICMLISCLTVGIITTDAAKVDSEATGLDSGDGIHLGIGTTTTTWHGMGTSAYEFTLDSAKTIYYTFSCSGSNFGYGSGNSVPSATSSESATWYADKNSGSKQFSIALPAGTYKFQLIGVQSNNTNCLEYKFWVVSSGGGGGDEPSSTAKYYLYGDQFGGWSWTDTDAGWASALTEMDYDSSTGYYYKAHHVPSSGNDYYRVGKRENSASTHYGVTSDTQVVLDGAKATSNSGWDKSFWLRTSSNAAISNKDVVVWWDATNKKTWVTTATNPTAASLTISANPETLSEVNESSTITVTAGTLAYTTGRLTYTLYKSDGTQVATKNVVANTTTTTFTVTPNARSTDYYATVQPQTTGTNYDSVRSNSITITNSNDEYIPKYTVTFSSNNNSYGTVTAKTADGTVLTSGTKVKEGTSVIFTAEPKSGYVFVEWDAFDNTASTVTRIIRSDTTVQGKFGAKGYQIIAGSNTGVAMKELSNGTYISANTYSDGSWFQIVRNSDNKSSVGNNADDSSHCQYIDDSDKHSVTSWRTRPTSWNYIGSFANKTGGARYVVYDPSTDKVWLTSDKDDLYDVKVVAKDGTIRYGYQKLSDYTQEFGDTTVELVTPDSISGTVDNNAYDGMAVAYNLKANDVRNGVTLKIKTQTKAAYVAKGYYVKGFVVSGYEETFSVLEQEFSDTATTVGGKEKYAEKSNYKHKDWINSGYNEFELTIEGYPEKNIEITPVYFIKETYSGDNIRFYVDAFAGDVYKNWGGTLAIDAYNTSGARMFGEYPGQPMINYNGRYMVDLPREGVTGITLNNYVWDRIHSNLFYGTDGTATGHESTVQASNYQTYDFNDFTYLKQRLDQADEDEDIIFSFRYKRNSSYNTKAKSNLGTSTYYKDNKSSSASTDNDYRKGFNTINPADSIYQWENLTDFYGNRVDIFGDYVDQTDSDGNPTNAKAEYTNPIRIVSNGYDYNEAGKFATAWALYKPVDASGKVAYTGYYDHYELFEVYGGQGIVSGGKATHGSSSYLVNPKWTTNLRDKYDKAYAEDTSKTHESSFVEDLARIPTVISYEYEVYDGFSNLNLEGATGDGNPGYRSDGRWFVTSSDQLLTAHVIVEYAEKDEESAYTRDYFQSGGVDYLSDTYDAAQNTGLATGIKAYFTNSDSDSVATTTYTNTSGNTEAFAVSDGEHYFNLATVGDTNGDYTFKGWYLYTNGKYSFVSRSETYPSEATANDVYVARYYKTPSGTLNITHSLHPDSTGSADCYAKVEVMSGNTVKYTYNETTDSIKVSNTYMKSDSENTLRITLRTVPDSGATFEGFYQKLSDTIDALSKTGVLASVSVDDSDPSNLKATITTTAIKNFFKDGEQTVKALPFYSLVHSIPHDVHITKSTNNPNCTDYFKIYVDVSVDGIPEPVFTVEETDNVDLPEWESIHYKYEVEDVGVDMNSDVYPDTKDVVGGGFWVKANSSFTVKNVPEGAVVSVYEDTNVPGLSHFHYDVTNSSVTGSNSYEMFTPTDGESLPPIPGEDYLSDGTGDIGGSTMFGYDIDMQQSDVDVIIYNMQLNVSLTYKYTSYRSLHSTQGYHVTLYLTNEDVDNYFTYDGIYDEDTKADVDGYTLKEDDNKRAAFINHYGPYENNYRVNLKWNTKLQSEDEPTGVGIKFHSETQKYIIDVNPDPTESKFVNLTFRLPYEHTGKTTGYVYRTTNGNVVYDDTQSDEQVQDLDYMSWWAWNGVKNYDNPNKTPEFVTAPDKVVKDGETLYFRYWSVSTVPNDTNYQAVEYTRCFSKEFNLCIYQDSIVTPVFTKLADGEAIPTPHSEAMKNSKGATITFIENSRNQYNEYDYGTNMANSRKQQGDRIYTDFLMSFGSPEDLKYQDYADGEYTAGLLIERAKELDTDNFGKYVTKSDAEYAADTTMPAVNETTLKNFVKGAGATNEAEKATEGYGYQYQKVEFDANELDNKNRIEYYFSMAVRNHSGDFVDNGAKNYVYRAYSYIKDKDGNVTMFSTPLYFTIYDMASIENAGDAN